MSADAATVPDRRPSDDPAATPPDTESTPSLRDRAPRGRGGARPGAGRPKGSKTKTKRPTTKTAPATKTTATVAQQDAKLTANLTRILELPVIPARQAGFAFAVAHWSETAAPTAEMIVAASRTWPELRHFLTNADQLISGKVLLAAALASYLAPVAAFIAGQPNIAYGTSRVSPQQVGAIEEMLTLPPEVAYAVQVAHAAGEPDAVIAGIVEAHYAAQAATTASAYPGGGPTPAGPTPTVQAA